MRATVHAHWRNFRPDRTRRNGEANGTGGFLALGCRFFRPVDFDCPPAHEVLRGVLAAPRQKRHCPFGRAAILRRLEVEAALAGGDDEPARLQLTKVAGDCRSVLDADGLASLPQAQADAAVISAVEAAGDLDKQGARPRLQAAPCSAAEKVMQAQEAVTAPACTVRPVASFHGEVTGRPSRPPLSLIRRPFGARSTRSQRARWR